MAEHTIKDSLSSVAEYIGEAVATKENAFRVTTMPTASADYAGEIYQYVGATDASYTNGYYYECAEDNGVYGWQQINVQPSNESGQTIQYDEMPVASVDNLNQIIQYTGATTSVAPIYTNGYFYKCVAQGTDPETYAWEEIRVSEAKEERIGEEITEIGVDYDATRTDSRIIPYIVVDLLDVLTKDEHTLTSDDIAYCKSLYDAGRITQNEYNEVVGAFVIPSFSTASFDDIATISNLYYDGFLSLEDIQSVWSVGDSKDMLVSAMSATGVGETHAEQTVTVKLVDFNHDALVTAEGEKTKALLTLGFVLAENGYYHPTYNDAKWGITDNSEGWKNSARRTWCNSICFDALPNGVKEVLKSVNKTMNNERDGGTYTVADKIFLPTINEFIGKNATASDVANASTALLATLTGTRYALYLSQPTHSKALYSSSNIYHSYTDWMHIEQQYVTADGGARCCWQTELRGIAPHFCI